jgi:hypothetical protein
MHRLKIYKNPVKNGRKVDLCNKVTSEGDIVKVQAHLNAKFTVIAA